MSSLPERDLQPGAVAGELVDAVQFQVEQFTDPQSARALQQQCVCDQPVPGSRSGSG